MGNNIFQQRIKILTGSDIDLKSPNFAIDIPVSYRRLAGKELGEKCVTIREIAEFVDWVLERKEEYDTAKRDKHGRFNHDSSFLVESGLDQTPVVDDLVINVIRQIGLHKRNIWPDGKKAAVCITHDVDSIDGFSYFWIRKLNWYARLVKAALKGNCPEIKTWSSTLMKWNQYKKNNIDPMDSIPRIQELEESYRLRSTFYFMSLRYALSREGRRYSIGNDKLNRYVKDLVKGGWEIGLHATYHRPLSVSALKEQKQRLEDLTGQRIMGCRHHYLRVNFPESWKIYEAAGFKYSSNMGWGRGYQGFRAGTCLPYYPLKGHAIMEIPFQLMDANPIEDINGYLNLFRRYLKSVKAVNGCLVVNFHQEYFQEEAARGPGKVFRGILESISHDSELAVLKMTEVKNIIERVGTIVK